MRLGFPQARVGRIALALVCLGVVSLVAHAQDHPSARLIYERDQSARQCPDEPELRDLVSARLGYVPFREDAGVVVTTRIEATPRGLRATVEARNAAGEITGRREIVSRTRDCQELARGVALAISVAIDPFVLTGGAPIAEASDASTPSVIDPVDADVPDASPVAQVDAGAPEDASTPPPETLVVPSDAPPVEDDRERVLDEDRAIHVALGASVGVGTGVVPDTRPFFAIDAELVQTFFLARVVARFDLPASDSRNVGGTVTASRFSTRLDACGGAGFVYACAGPSLRVFFAHGSDIETARSDTRLSLAFVGQIVGRAALSDHVWLHGALGLEAPFRPASLELDGAAVWREPGITPFFEVGALWRIP